MASHNNTDQNSLAQQLSLLGLSNDEATLYLELLKGPATHLALSRSTGINRTKVYRLAESLEKRSLVARHIDDQGVFLMAADPSTLEVELLSQEEKLRQQRNLLNALMPELGSLQNSSGRAFTVRTYDGIDGFKQMLWHELKTQGEILVFGDGYIEDLVPSRTWAEQHRARTVEAGYHVRELMNPGVQKTVFTSNAEYMHQYEARALSSEILLLEQQVAIYNSTVAFYHWRHEQKIGVEIINASVAQMMRQVYECYWQLAKIL